MFHLLFGQVLPEKHNITQTVLVSFTAQRARSNTVEWPLMQTKQATFPLPSQRLFLYQERDKEFIEGTCNPLPQWGLSEAIWAEENIT